MTEPTANDGLIEELLTLDYLDLLGAVLNGDRREGTEHRIAAFLANPDGWPAFRRGCDFNGMDAEAKEEALRLAIRLYGVSNPDAPQAFRTVLLMGDVAHPRCR